MESFFEGLGIFIKNTIMIRVAVPVRTNAADAPNLYQIKPVRVLDSMAQMLWSPEKVPIAVAVSFLSTMFEIHAFEIPSVAEA